MSYPKDAARIHTFKVGSRQFVLDVHSCIYTKIDNLARAVIEKSTKVTDKTEIIKSLQGKYKVKDIYEAVNEMEEMETRGFLFSEDPLRNYRPGLSDVGTLCLNVAQDCNLACTYCFARKDYYKKSDARMLLAVAQKAIDFLIGHSGNRKELSLCFFGGEPLLNFSVVRQAVRYAVRRGKESDKQFRFNLTTNGTALTRKVRDFLKAHGFGLIFSIDGPQDIQDAQRPFLDGSGSYEVVSRNLMGLMQGKNNSGIGFSVRATFTRKSYDISKIALHLAKLGCYDISVEPGVIRDEALEIRYRDIAVIKKAYSDFAQAYIEEIMNGRYFSFFHFRHGMDQAYQATRNLNQCGAGAGYLAVSSDGKIYPCHRFVGKDKFCMGDVFTGIVNDEIGQLFNAAIVNNKPKCLKCWARYVCGGGCHAYAIEFNDDITKPYAVECALMKHRIKLGAFIYSELVDHYPDIMKTYYRQSSSLRPYLNPDITLPA